MQHTTWVLNKKYSPQFLEKFPELSEIELQLLSKRGLTTKEKIQEFFSPDFATHVFDGIRLQGMKKALKRVYQALQKNERILIFGDFDVDGITSCIVMKKTFEFLGKDVEIFIPERDKSHGMRIEYIDDFVKKGIQLIITVDCGISNVDETDYAKKNGIDLIITDHHDIPSHIPSAYTIINPKQKRDSYPFNELCGAGVAFKFAQQLLQCSDKNKKKQEHFIKWLLDIVAIGTIGDCVPLISENRTLTLYGLIVLNKTRRVGLRALLEVSGCDGDTITSQDVMYKIVPRLNAASRLKHADLAFQLLSTDNEHQARILSRTLNRLNSERKELTKRVTDEVINQIEKHEMKHILIAQSPDWPVGVNGIVASKIMETYKRPAIIMRTTKNETIASGRSIPGFDITKAVTYGKRFLIRFGGHPGACGFTIKTKNIDAFLSALLSYASRKLDDKQPKEKICVDARIDLQDVDWNLYHTIEKFQPFGAGNAEPIFYAQRAIIHDLRFIGSDNAHVQINFKHKNGILRAVGFHFGEQAREFQKGDELDILFRVSENTWNGEKNLQIEIVDLKRSQSLYSHRKLSELSLLEQSRTI